MTYGTRLGRALLGCPYYIGAGWGRVIASGPLAGVSFVELVRRGTPMFDCSGLVVALLVADGRWDPKRAAPRAVDLANMCDPVALPQEGDLGFFGKNRSVSHVVYYSSPTSIIGANHGGGGTYGDDPDARVKEETNYWPDGFIVAGRLKPGAGGAR